MSVKGERVAVAAISSTITGLIATAAVTQAEPVSLEIFSKHVTAMRAFYTSSSTSAYPLPVTVSHPIGVRLIKPADSADIGMNARAALVGWVQEQHAELLVAVTRYQQTGDLDAFKRELDALRAHSLAEMRDHLNSTYDRLERAASTDAAARPVVLRQAQQTGTLIQGIVYSASNLLNTVTTVIAGASAAAQAAAQAAQAAAAQAAEAAAAAAQAAAQAAEKAAEDTANAVAAAANAAANWVSGAVSDVGSAIASIF